MPTKILKQPTGNDPSSRTIRDDSAIDEAFKRNRKIINRAMARNKAAKANVPQKTG